MDPTQFTREAMLSCGDIFDMQAAPFGAVTKRYGFTGDVVMLAGAYFEFIALSDQSAHVGHSPVARWEEVLKVARNRFTTLPNHELVQSVILDVDVIDPDGQRRTKKLEIAADQTHDGDSCLVFLLPQPEPKKSTPFWASVKAGEWIMMSEEPYGSVSRDLGITLPVALTPPVFLAFLEVSLSPAHANETVLARWKNVLLAFREHFTEADIKEHGEIIWGVPVLDPDGEVRIKKLRVGYVFDEDETPVLIFKETAG
jgi:hypothetical protein